MLSGDGFRGGVTGSKESELVAMDPIADLLTIIRNAQAVGKEKVELPHSTAKEVLSRLLKDNGYLSDVRVFKVSGKVYKRLSLTLRYIAGRPAVGHIELVSKPGKRVYASRDKLPQALRGGVGIVIVSTSRGLMTSAEARKRNLGGEVICQVW